jgi:uncharacterized protein YbjQ (UPF0145 family)
MSVKKDLTRIEDLSEFIHELEKEQAEELPPDYGQDIFSQEDQPEEPIEAEALTPDFNSDLSETSTQNFTQDQHEEEEESLSQETSYFLQDSEKAPSLIDDSPLPSQDYALDLKTEEINYPPQETFEDLKNFSETSAYSSSVQEANPAFSLLIREVRFKEDVEDILEILENEKLIFDSLEQVRSRLLRGSLLIPRLSEFCAIILAHKLRKFEIDISMGLSDEIHPPKYSEQSDLGVVSKSNLYQNQNHHFNFDHTKLDLTHIMLSSTPNLEGHTILKYIGVATEHMFLDSHVVEDENSLQVPVHYQELANRLKYHAMKVNSNAVVGLNYQLTPLPSESGHSFVKYRLSCTGNLVWVNKT